MGKVVIVVPWRDKGDPDRRANLNVVIDRLDDLHIGEVCVVGDGRTGPFNRSAAYNAGRAKHPDASAYVWHEADMLVPRRQLVDGINLALATHTLVVPFLEYAYIAAIDTPRVRDQTLPLSLVKPERVMADGRSVGAVGITSRVAMDAVGRWDEQFSGWGYDDRAMARAFEVACGPLRFIPGTGWHLYHTPGWQAGGSFRGGARRVSAEERRATAANRRRYDRYVKADTAEAIRALTG